MSVATEIQERIVGRRVVRADGGSLFLDDGTELKLWESAQDCCACAYGEWEILDPNALEAIITKVEVDVDEVEIADDDYDYDGRTNTAKITILHNQNRIALADCSANDGNGGYYFSVLTLDVLMPDGKFSVDVVSA